MKKRIYKILAALLSVMFVLPIVPLSCKAVDIDNQREDALVKADELLGENVFTDILSSFTKGIRESASSFSKVFAAMLFMTFMLGIMRISDANSSAIYAGEICLCTFSFSVTANVLENIGSYLSALENFMLSMLPVMTSLYAASSAPSTATLNYGSTLLSLNVCNTVFTSLLLPGIKCILFLAVLSFVSKSFDFSGVTVFIKNTLGWIFGLLMCAMSAVIAFQNVISLSRDGVMGRTVRFAASRFIPVIGNTVSESARTLSQSLKLVRSVSGTAGIFAIAGIIAAPVASLLVCRFFVNMCGAAARLFAVGKTAKYFSELSEVMNLLLGVVTGISLVFVLILGMFASVPSVI